MSTLLGFFTKLGGLTALVLLIASLLGHLITLVGAVLVLLKIVIVVIFIALLILILLAIFRDRRRRREPEEL
jgi:hypothetical protein